MPHNSLICLSVPHCCLTTQVCIPLSHPYQTLLSHIMAPVIWGLNLAEIKWSKFKSSYMWNNAYHLRRTKFIVYQCALIFCVFSESLATAVLSDFIDQQKAIKRMNPEALMHNNDYVGAGSFNIWSGIFCATIFGAAFFFDLFWPERHESASVRLAWKICGVLASVFMLANALALTIITATHSAYISGASGAEASRLESAVSTKPPNPFVYRHNGRALASVVFVWLGWASTVGR